MPIRARLANRSVAASISAQTLLTTDPTARQVICSNSVIVVFAHAVASHATVSSKSRVTRAPCRAHGTAAVTT